MSASGKRVELLRQSMVAKGLDALIVFTADAHNSEIPSARDERRKFLSDFNGSSGTAVVTHDKALLWTDGRYFVQATQQLDSSVWTLMKSGLKGVPKICEWLNSEPSVVRLGLDPLTTPVTEYRNIAVVSRVVSGKMRIAFVDGAHPVDAIWGAEQPAFPQSQVDVHSPTGMTVQEKFQLALSQMKMQEADAILLTCLDEVAWYLNLRGKDINYSPVFLGYVLITPTGNKIYADTSRFSPEALQHLKSCDIDIRPYDAVTTDIKALYEGASPRLWLDPGVNMAIYNAVTQPNQNILLKITPICLAKAKKNEVELQGMREAHLRDGVAVTAFLSYLQGTLKDSPDKLFCETECTLQQRLDKLRTLQTGSRGPSFPTISAIGPNGAVIHYRPEEATCRTISKSMYLVDSGGQYDCGTTDTTRTVHFGVPTAFEKDCWTRVLKGFIAMSSAIFPKGTKGPHIDCLARQSLWQVGLDYRHGTGHGVGAYLNVHEGPQSISQRTEGCAVETALDEGMVVSVEPGFYKDGEFGIRIENLVEVVKCELPHNFGDVGFLTFKQLTMIPLNREMMDLSLMTSQEIGWVDVYHQQVRDKLLPRLDPKTDKSVVEFLVESTLPLRPN
eukprot:GHVS01072652.1.p1 GENE.GHVS01072652.1~~GHVS01072652.1.p1  ORF type:complete len:616 (+),score=80.93 GHVS01072652.1:74-1921(+)